MEKGTADEHKKLSTMKLNIVYFVKKLENFIDETSVTDENLLKLLSHLTDCIESFVSTAEVIQTNHCTEPEIDTEILTCENVFECHICNVQTGKTYASVINHFRNGKHISRAKNVGKQIPPISKPIADRPINNTVNSAPMIMPPTIPINRDLGTNSNQTRDLNSCQHLFQNTPNVLMAGLTRPVIENNNNSSVNELVNNFNHAPDFIRNYKELFKMPSPDCVIGFQQNVVDPSNDFFRNDCKIESNDEESIEHEQQPHAKKQRKNRKKRRSKTSNLDYEKIINNVEVLDLKVVAFLNGHFEIDVTQFMSVAQDISNKDYTRIITNLKDSCKEMDLNVEVACFGSRIIGIGTINSDIDFNVSVIVKAAGNSFFIPAAYSPVENLSYFEWNFNSTDVGGNFLKNLENILRNDSNWNRVHYIRSRVSLVRAHNINMNIDCDITLNNDLAMANTKLVKYFYSIQPECYKVAVFIRIWCKKAKLYPHMNTYTMNLLVFYYFQSKGYLPKVMDLVETSTTKYWPNKFQSKSLSELNIELATNFKALCADMMDFYAHRARCESNILSIFTGSTIPKALFGTGEFRQQNDCFQGLFRYMDENPRKAESIKVDFSMAMCIQDPFSHDHNVSRCVGRSKLKRFKDYCHQSYKILQRQIFENNSD